MPINEKGPFITSAEADAFETIFTRNYPLVYRLAYRYVEQPDEAEDIAQEVFMRFYHLPERQQVCLMLRSTGFSYEEIADATGIPITSIGSVLARAMQAFRRSYHE